MLTDAGLRDLLGAGYETSDAEFVEHTQVYMSRTVYFMAQFLAERQHRYISSVELQDRIKERLTESPRKTRFNPVDWFSEQWTESKKGKASSHFDDRYRELFDREGSKPTSYRIKPALFENVVRILSDLHSPGSISAVPLRVQESGSPRSSSHGGEVDTTVQGATGPDLGALAEQLDAKGDFNPTSLEDARVRALRAVVLRQGQPKFRAALMNAYGMRCAITACDAAAALEAAHVKPYEGPQTNDVTNGILLRADIHTLFDLNLLGIEPSERRVRVSPQLHQTVYREFDGILLRAPNDPSASPSAAALAWRWKLFLSQR
jgi:hypothetical protein